jgi:hypothetical protein
MAHGRLTQRVIRELLSCDGNRLFWRARSPEWFSSSRIARAWNARWAGRRALTCDDGNGHPCGSVLGTHQYASRIIYLWRTGKFPTKPKAKELRPCT